MIELHKSLSENDLVSAQEHYKAIFKEEISTSDISKYKEDLKILVSLGFEGKQKLNRIEILNVKQDLKELEGLKLNVSNVEKALKNLIRAVEIVNRIDGEISVDMKEHYLHTLNSLISMSNIYSENEQLLNSCEYMQKCSRLLSALVTKDDVRAILVKAGIANLLRKNKCFSNALLFYEDVKDSFCRTEGEVSEGCICALYNIALVFQQAGNSQKAIQYIQKAIALEKKAK
jgi:tetratricopeptide (TPR) repeat protein